MGEAKSFGLGLIGCGAFGQFCMATYAKMPQVRPAAMVDVQGDLARRVGRAFGVPAFESPGELLDRPDVDIVHVATPPSTHHQLVLAAARAGKHVLCEKPLAMNTAEGSQMLAAVAAKGLIAPTNLILRYNAVTVAAKAVIDSGALGTVLSARLTNCASDTNLGTDHWFWAKEVSGGIFIEHGVHFFDLYSAWFGAGQVVNAHTETRPGTSQEDRVTCTVRHEGGTLASHYHGFDQPMMLDRTDHRLVCELGDIRIDGWIPLTLTVEAAVSAAGAAALRNCCDWTSFEVVATFEGESGRRASRGVQRRLDQHISARFTPNTDKQAVYAANVQALLADQLARLTDPAHTPIITEANGLDALALGEAAVNLAGKST